MATEFLDYPGCQIPDDTHRDLFNVVSAVSNPHRWQEWPAVGARGLDGYPSGPPGGVAIEVTLPESSPGETVLSVTVPRLPSYPLPQTAATEFRRFMRLDGLVEFHELQVSAGPAAGPVEVSVMTVIKGQLAEGSSGGDTPFYATYMQDTVNVSPDEASWSRVFKNLKHSKDGIVRDPPNGEWYASDVTVVNDLWPPGFRRSIARVVLSGMYYGKHPTTTIIASAQGDTTRVSVDCLRSVRATER